MNVLNENEVGPSRASAVVLFRRVGSDVCEAWSPRIRPARGRKPPARHAGLVTPSLWIGARLVLICDSACPLGK